MGDDPRIPGVDGEIIAFRSKNPFEFTHILRGLDDCEDQRVFGWLILPPDAPTDARLPAVVACHGSMGWRGHHHEHLVNWLEAGFAVFRIHHFEARGVASIVQDQMQVTVAMLIVDAYRALQKLAAHPRIDAARVGISGWSLGGSAALYAAYEPIREAIVGADGPRFAAHLPFYPAAHVWPERQAWSPAPIRVLHGAADDYTPPEFVRGLIERVGGAARIDAVYYEDGHHSFDSIEPAVYIPDAVRLGRRHVTLHEDHTMSVTSSDGTRHPVGEPADRQKSFEKARNVGAHTGGSWEIRRRAFADARAFFRETLGAG